MFEVLFSARLSLPSSPRAFEIVTPFWAAFRACVSLLVSSVFCETEGHLEELFKRWLNPERSDCRRPFVSVGGES